MNKEFPNSRQNADLRYKIRNLSLRMEMDSEEKVKYAHSSSQRLIKPTTGDSSGGPEENID